MDPLSAIASICNKSEIIIPGVKYLKSISVHYMKNGSVEIVYLHESQLFDFIDQLEP